MDVTAAVGTAATFARADHVHPVDTSRYAATNPSGYQTAAQVTASLGPYALIASPTFTGVPAGPTASPGTNTTQLATTAFVATATTGSVVTNPNRLDNGDMWVDQHNRGASVAVPAGGAGVVCPDRWGPFSTKAKFTVGQNYSVATRAPNFPYFLGVQTTGTGAAPVAADLNVISQGIEFDTFNDFGWGTANAQPATLSFWVNSSLTGNFAVCGSGWMCRPIGCSSPPTTSRLRIRGLRSPSQSPPTPLSHRPMRWTGAGNSPGLAVVFDLGTGATAQTSTGLGAWQNSATVAVASGAVKPQSPPATPNGCDHRREAGVGQRRHALSDQGALARSLARCQRCFVAKFTDGASLAHGQWA